MAGKLLLEKIDFKQNLKENMSILLENLGYGLLGASGRVADSTDLCGLSTKDKWYMDILIKTLVVHRLTQYNANVELFYKLLAELADIDMFECKNAITECRKKYFTENIKRIQEELI